MADDFLPSTLSWLELAVQVQEVVLISQFFVVAKRISLFLARKWPQMTIDHLVYEINYMLHDEDALPARPAPVAQVHTM